MATREDDGLLQHQGGPNRTAAEAMVAALKAGGFAKPVDDARIAAFLTLADIVDGGSQSNSQMWAQYRDAEKELRKGIDAGSDEATALIDYVRSAMGDSSNPEPKDKGRRGGRNLGTARKAPDAAPKADSGRSPRGGRGRRVSLRPRDSHDAPPEREDLAGDGADVLEGHHVARAAEDRL